MSDSYETLSVPMAERNPLARHCLRFAYDEYVGMTSRFASYGWEDGEDFVVSLFDNHDRPTVQYIVTEKDFSKKVKNSIAKKSLDLIS